MALLGAWQRLRRHSGEVLGVIACWIKIFAEASLSCSRIVLALQLLMGNHRLLLYHVRLIDGAQVEAKLIGLSSARLRAQEACLLRLAWFV